MPLSTIIEEQVIELRSKKLLKLPDAIVAATALSIQVPLVTNDSTFERVSSLILERF